MAFKKRLSHKEAVNRLAKYCAYQERSQQQVRDKCYELGLFRDEVEEVIAELITEGFINEERFSRSYVGGKFRLKKWGRIKILAGLKQHKISTYCINKGLSEISVDEYTKTIDLLIEKKLKSLSEEDPYILKQKIARYVINKGFEPEAVWQGIQKQNI